MYRSCPISLAAYSEGLVVLKRKTKTQCFCSVRKFGLFYNEVQRAMKSCCSNQKTKQDKC